MPLACVTPAKLSEVEKCSAPQEAPLLAHRGSLLQGLGSTSRMPPVAIRRPPSNPINQMLQPSVPFVPAVQHKSSVFSTRSRTAAVTMRDRSRANEISPYLWNWRYSSLYTSQCGYKRINKRMWQKPFKNNKWDYNLLSNMFLLTLRLYPFGTTEWII